MLKLTPDAEIAAAEAFALRSWEPSGRVPEVWSEDAGLGALLLEAIPNETPLSALGRSVELHEIAGLIRSLHACGAPLAGSGIRPLAEAIEFIFTHWIERRSPRDALAERLRRGRELARELAADGGEQVLLHGDLGPSNVLDGGAERGLVAIDPRPSIGDAAVDAVDWVFWGADNPSAWEPRSRELARALGVDRERLWAWCAAFAAMLAASRVGQGASAEEIDALLALAP